jgi:uncharacterized membrane protein (UPF0182 family)
MIIPKRRADDYTPPAIINEYDQIHQYIREGKTLSQIKSLMSNAISEEKIDQMYLHVLRHLREAKDEKTGTIVMGFILFFVGLWLSVRNVSSILQQIQTTKGDENFYVTSSFFEFKHPFWLLIFGTMFVSGLILLVNGVFKKIRI